METDSQRTELLRKIKEEVVNLKESSLYADRIQSRAFPVIGEGSHHAAIMFIGEAPGRNEAATGRPFCGAAGKILDNLLSSVLIARQDVYVTNIVKDRPPMNRDPFPDEIALYAPFLERQIAIIRPKVLATLGRFSMDYVMKLAGLEESLDSISKIHGTVFRGNVSYGSVDVIPLYHPAAAIYHQALLDTLKKDFQILAKYKTIS